MHVPAQVTFWRGAFGDAYRERNAPSEAAVQAKIAVWSRVLRALCGAPPDSILEIGANTGINLRALRQVTSATLSALEPNAEARKQLLRDGVIAPDNVYDGFASAIPLPDAAADLVFTSGVLIHIAPDDLPQACREIHRVARRYIGCIEYFSAVPEEKSYRGHAGVLFKRDFGSYWLEQFPQLRVLDYGFFWKPVTGQDNMTWWLFEKR